MMISGNYCRASVTIFTIHSLNSIGQYVYKLTIIAICYFLMEGQTVGHQPQIWKSLKNKDWKKMYK